MWYNGVMRAGEREECGQLEKEKEESVCARAIYGIALFIKISQDRLQTHILSKFPIV
jgi:hypothetical protein